MIALIQRVSEASITADGEFRGSIGQGLMVLVCGEKNDKLEYADALAEKVVGYRVFSDADGKMNLAPADAGAAELLIVSQFTLFADCKSRRPGFSKAARPDKAIPLYELVISQCRERGFKVETGVFAAYMQVASVNDGPITIIIDTKEL